LILRIKFLKALLKLIILVSDAILTCNSLTYLNNEIRVTPIISLLFFPSVKIL